VSVPSKGVTVGVTDVTCTALSSSYQEKRGREGGSGKGYRIQDTGVLHVMHKTCRKRKREMGNTGDGQTDKVIVKQTDG
jgi:hypothetical protein